MHKLRLQFQARKKNCGLVRLSIGAVSDVQSQPAPAWVVINFWADPEQQRNLGMWD